MRGLILTLVTALPLSFAAVPAGALPITSMTGTQAPTIIRVAGGCGLGFHRGPYGGCRPNGAFIVRPRVCPPGYHLGPYGRLCRPNF